MAVKPSHNQDQKLLQSYKMVQVTAMANLRLFAYRVLYNLMVELKLSIK